MEQQDYYQILGVAKTAGSKTIKEAYRNLALAFHPDRNQSNPAAAEKMKAVNEAYAVLSDDRKRREYDALRDQFGASAYSQFRKNYSEQDIFSGSDINRIFEEMARSFGFRGVDEIFKEFYGQGYNRFDFKRQGVSVRGFGFPGGFGRFRPSEKGRAGGMPGINMGRLARRVFQKISGVKIPEKGGDMSDVIRLRSQLARDGGPYAYYLKKKKKKLVVKIPPGIRNGQRIRLNGMGKPGKGGGQPGDFYLKVQIKKTLMEKLKSLWAGLRP